MGGPCNMEADFYPESRRRHELDDRRRETRGAPRVVDGLCRQAIENMKLFALPSLGYGWEARLRSSRTSRAGEQDAAPSAELGVGTDAAGCGAVRHAAAQDRNSVNE